MHCTFVKPLCQPLYGLSRAIHGMLSWAPSKRVISYPLAWRLRPEVIPVGSKIGNATGVLKKPKRKVFFITFCQIIYTHGVG